MVTVAAFAAWLAVLVVTKLRDRSGLHRRTAAADVVRRDDGGRFPAAGFVEYVTVSEVQRACRGNAPDARRR